MATQGLWNKGMAAQGLWNKGMATQGPGPGPGPIGLGPRPGTSGQGQGLTGHSVVEDLRTYPKCEFGSRAFPQKEIRKESGNGWTDDD